MTTCHSTYLPTFGYSKSGHPMAGGPGGRLGPRRGPAAELLAGVREQRPLKPLDFSNFKGQGNTIFILKIDVLKVQTGSVAIFPYKKKKKKNWDVPIFGRFESCKSGQSR